MVDTAGSMIYSSFKKIKAYAPGIPMSDADAEEGLDRMNKMLDKWSNEWLATFANLEQSFTLTPGVQTYTIGPGGAINAIRPLNLRTGKGAAYTMDTNNVRYDVDVVEQDVWNSIGLLTTTSTIITTLFYDPQNPLGIINVFPVPLMSYAVYFDARLQLANLTSLTTQLALPVGYSNAIIDGLAERLWPYFKQGDPPRFITEEAKESLASVKRTNIKISPATYDNSIVSRARSTYNIYTDDSGRNNG